MDQYLLIQFLGGWTSIYQLFWCSPGVQGFDTLPYIYITPYCYVPRAVSYTVFVKSTSGLHESRYNRSKATTVCQHSPWLQGWKYACGSTFKNLEVTNMNSPGWWFQPLWKNMKVNEKDYPIYIMENKIHVWNHQPEYEFMISLYDHK